MPVKEAVEAPALSPIAALRERLAASRKQVMKIAPQPLSRKADRQAEIRKKLASYDVAELKEELTEYIDLVTTYLGDDVVLKPQFAEVAMRQAKATQHLEEIAAVVKKAIKKVVFDHMNAVNAEDPTIEDPVNVNAKLPVPGMGLEFSREGAGVDYTANIPALKMLLEKAGINWESVFDVETKVVYTLNTDALWAVLKNNDTLQDEVLSVIEEAPKSARLNLRPLQPTEDDE